MIQYKDKSVALRATIPNEAYEWRNHPDIFKWCRQFTLLSRDQHEAWMKSLPGRPDVKMFGVFTSGAYVGVCGLTGIDRVNQRAEFSLYIGPEFQGKGYGKDALYTLLRHGFEDMNLFRIWGETFDGNPAFSMFKNLGMVYEGTQRKSYFRNGKFIDSHLVGMLREEFKP